MTNPAVSLDAVEEAPVWLEVNGAPAVTWMCTPEQLDELVVGWLHGEGYIDTAADILRMRPCAQELGFWVDVPAERFQTVEASDRRRVLASGCGAVTTILGSLSSLAASQGRAPARRSRENARALQGALRARHALQGNRRHPRRRDHRWRDAALSRRGHRPAQCGRQGDRRGDSRWTRARKTCILLVTGRISGELAFKAARARIGLVATPSVPSTIAVDIAQGDRDGNRRSRSERNAAAASDVTAPCTGVILAGGQASRYGGRPKGLERVHGSARDRSRGECAARAETDSLLLIANDPRRGGVAAGRARRRAMCGPASGAWAASTRRSCTRERR